MVEVETRRDLGSDELDEISEEELECRLEELVGGRLFVSFGGGR